LLELAGEKVSYASPSQIFQALTKEVAGYEELNYEIIGNQGVQVGGSAATGES